MSILLFKASCNDGSSNLLTHYEKNPPLPVAMHFIIQFDWTSWAPAFCHCSEPLFIWVLPVQVWHFLGNVVRIPGQSFKQSIGSHANSIATIGLLRWFMNAWCLPTTRAWARTQLSSDSQCKRNWQSNGQWLKGNLSYYNILMLSIRQVSLPDSYCNVHNSIQRNRSSGNPKRKDR
jgi:hypothetical protein